MFLTVLLAKERRQALVVPEEALVPEQSKQYVYLMVGGRAIKREVRIGRREPGRVEIAEGISEGDRIVTEGTLKLREGAPVRELGTGDAPPGAPPAGKRAS
jgi:membrane fusion protein (multidrug efflux system)